MNTNGDADAYAPVHIQYSTFLGSSRPLAEVVADHVLGETGRRINVMQSGRCTTKRQWGYRRRRRGGIDGSFRTFAPDLLVLWVFEPDVSVYEDNFGRAYERSRRGQVRPRSSCKPSHCTMKSRIFDTRTSHR